MIVSCYILTWSVPACCHSWHGSGQCLLPSETLGHHSHRAPLGPQQLQGWKHPDYLLVISLRKGGDPDSKESVCSAGNPGSILGLGRSRGERNSYPLQYSGLENPMDRAATVHGVTKSWT